MYSNQDIPGEAAIGLIDEVSGNRATCKIERSLLRRFESSGLIPGAVGSQVKIRAGDVWLIAEVRDLKPLPGEQGDWLVAGLEFLGEGDASARGLANFRRGVSSHPIPGARAYAVDAADISEIFGSSKSARVEIGTIHPQGVRAAISIDQMLGKHFAVFGSSGTGKSTLLALLLHRIIEAAPEGHVVLIDPHGEYGGSFRDRGVVYTVDNLRLPYWLMSFEEHCEVFITSTGADRETDRDILAECLLIARSRNELAASVRNLSVDTPMPYAIEDLIAALDEKLGKLERRAEASAYIRMKIKIEELARDSRFAFMFDTLLFYEALPDLISNLLRLPSNGRAISIIDVSRVPSEIVNVVVAVLSRLILNYAIWSRGETPKPILLVCEEAQNYLPSISHQTGIAATRVLEKIAKEGRKYGVSLGLVSQRPSDLSEGVLSQCGTMIALRLNNERDQACIRNAMPEAGTHFVESIQSLRNRDCIICGEAVPMPVRVRVDAIEPGREPNSHDPAFVEQWSRSGDEKEIVDRTVHRWLNRLL